MYSREASKKMRQEFWIAFGKSFPRKWILYQTKIKGLSFKFDFDTKKAIVCLDVEATDPQNELLWHRLLALRAILTRDHLKDAQYAKEYLLDSGKKISRVYVFLEDVSIHDKATWQKTMYFLYDRMDRFEGFFATYAELLEPGAD